MCCKSRSPVAVLVSGHRYSSAVSYLGRLQNKSESCEKIWSIMYNLVKITHILFLSVVVRLIEGTVALILIELYWISIGHWLCNAHRTLRTPFALFSSQY